MTGPVNASDGDTFFVSFPHKATTELTERLRSQFTDSFPNSKLIILECGAHVEAITKEENEAV